MVELLLGLCPSHNRIGSSGTVWVPLCGGCSRAYTPKAAHTTHQPNTTKTANMSHPFASRIEDQQLRLGVAHLRVCTLISARANRSRCTVESRAEHHCIVLHQQHQHWEYFMFNGASAAVHNSALPVYPRSLCNRVGIILEW